MLLGGWKKITQGKEPPLSEVSSSRYEFFTTLGNFTNTSSRFAVILGVDMTGLALGLTIGVVKAGIGYDTFGVFNAGSAMSASDGTGTTDNTNGMIFTVTDGGFGTNQLGARRHFLVPQGYTFLAPTSAARGFGVFCRSLRDALVIL